MGTVIPVDAQGIGWNFRDMQLSGRVDALMDAHAPTGDRWWWGADSLLAKYPSGEPLWLYEPVSKVPLGIMVPLGRTADSRAARDLTNPVWVKSGDVQVFRDIPGADGRPNMGNRIVFGVGGGSIIQTLSSTSTHRAMGLVIKQKRYSPHLLSDELQISVNGTSWGDVVGVMSYTHWTNVGSQKSSGSTNILGIRCTKSNVEVHVDFFESHVDQPTVNVFLAPDQADVVLPAPPILGTATAGRLIKAEHTLYMEHYDLQNRFINGPGTCTPFTYRATGLNNNESKAGMYLGNNNLILRFRSGTVSQFPSTEPGVGSLSYWRHENLLVAVGLNDYKFWLNDDLKHSDTTLNLFTAENTGMISLAQNSGMGQFVFWPYKMAP